MASKRPILSLTRLLDITRLVRRAGRPMTGIDRVEFAYLRALVQKGDPLFVIARTPFGYALLDESGAQAFLEAHTSSFESGMDIIGHLSPRRPRRVRAAEATLRRLSCARCLPSALPRMLRRHLPKTVRYLNVGHANFTPRMLYALRKLDAHLAVLVHDVIPLDAPHWQRSETAQSFATFLDRVGRNADLVIYSAEATKGRIEARLSPAPRALVAHLGVETAQPAPLPAGLRLKPPYFLCLGTIEPRKNHQFLLDLWDSLSRPAPTLVLAGHRGWNNETVFARLDRGVTGVIEAPGLSDGQIATLLDGANGLLFPSQIEGFGLPPMEAAMRGVPVLAQPLPVLKEVMGNVPIYAPATDVQNWRAPLLDLAETRRAGPDYTPPSWAAHFNAVLRVT